MDNQIAAYEKLRKLKVGALFLEMGMGKTKVALDLISSRSQKVDYILWICPFSIKDEIESERQKWHTELDVDIVGCESIGSSRRIHSEVLEKVKNAKCAFIVVDESLKIKNRYANRTRRILEMGKFAEYKLILNGTPVSKNILDLWTQMEFLSPKILDMWFLEFKNTYCSYYQKGKYKGRIISFKNIPHLVSKIEPYIFEAELDINTTKQYTTRFYYTDMDAYEEYKEKVFYEYYSEFDDELNFNAFSMKLQRWYTMNSNRNEVINDLIEDINDSVLIYVRFIDSIPEGAHRITGAENQKKRKEVLQDFKDGKFKALYITYGCGSFGLNLQYCKNIIFAEHMWDYAQRVQAEGRIYRMGQGKYANYYDLYCYDVGLEDLILACIHKKKSLDYTIKEEIAKTKGGVKEWVKSL